MNIRGNSYRLKDKLKVGLVGRTTTVHLNRVGKFERSHWGEFGDP